RIEVELHARSCVLCAERIQGFTDVFSLLDSWKGMATSPSFNARLEQRLEQDASAPGWWGSLLPRLMPQPLGNPVFAVALLVVVCLPALNASEQARAAMRERSIAFSRMARVAPKLPAPADHFAGAPQEPQWEPAGFPPPEDPFDIGLLQQGRRPGPGFGRRPPP